MGLNIQGINITNNLLLKTFFLINEQTTSDIQGVPKKIGPSLWLVITLKIINEIEN